MQHMPLKLFFKLLRCTFVHELSFEAIALIFGLELSCKCYFSETFFLKLLHGTVMKKLPFQATYQAFAWNCRTKVAL